MAKELLEFKCTAEKEVFASKDNDYKIYAMECFDERIKQNQYGNVSILGSFPELNIGVEYLVKAHEESNARGVSYRIRSITRERPLSEDGVKLFLKEILPMSQVNELIREYPNIIDLVMSGKDSDVDLNKLYNIKEARFAVIKRKILENFMFAQIVDEMKGLLDFDTVQKLHKEFSTVENIKERLTNEPYEVLCNISGIGFKTADVLLLNFEKECNKMEEPPIKFKEPLVTSLVRMVACVDYILALNENDGHTKMDNARLKMDCNKLTPQCISRFEASISNSNKFVVKDSYVSKLKTYNTEVYIADRIKNVLEHNESNKWDIDVSGYQNTEELSLTDKQMDTIKNVMKYNVSICNGFAGTGKSMATKVLVDILKDNNKSFTILAPTGRAKKVIAGYTKQPASTIHKLLYSTNFNTIHSDVIIIDEFSMVDVFLFAMLLESIAFKYTKIIIIGDSAQIPSVGAGNILHDLLNSNRIPTTTLDKVFRYGVGGVMTVATKTRMCEPYLEMKAGAQVIGEDKGYIFYHSNSVDTTIKTVKKIYTKLLLENKPEDILILSAYNIGDFGTISLNKEMQPIANPHSINDINVIEANKISFYVGDLVIQTKNNYNSAKLVQNPEDFDIMESMEKSKKLANPFDEVLISNGDIGKIERIYGEYALIDFDGERVVYNIKDLMTCKLAYAISVHRSQGGNAKHIILLSPKEQGRMLNSNLMYVGITRAKERVFHIGNVGTVNRSVMIKAENNRLTYLKEMLM